MISEKEYIKEVSVYYEINRLFKYEDWLLRQLDAVEKRLKQLGVKT